MHLAFLVAVLPLTGAIPRGPPDRRVETPATKASFEVTILADSNRDGKVDITGSTDLVGKQAWSEESGALFLANIVDTDRRCSSQITGSCADELADIFFLETTLPEKPVLDPKIEKSMPFWGYDDWFFGLSDSDQAKYKEWDSKQKEYNAAYWNSRNVDRRISSCHDASDDILRNASYLAPLRTVPSPGLSDAAIGSISVTDETAASNVRLFHKSGDGKWGFLSPNHTFKAQELTAGLELGIDGRDVRRPGGWDGRVTVELKVQDGQQEAKDSVVLRVAPVLTQHHGQPAKQLLTATGDGRGDQARFIKQLGELSTEAGVKAPLHVLNTRVCSVRNEIWAQDFFEPGYMSIPGPNGPVGIHIMIRSAQDHRNAGRKVFQDLRSGTVGAVQHLAEGSTTDSLGNLETVPPYKHNNTSYPAGRAVMGSGQWGAMPYLMEFLDAQETQAPIKLDTSWLAVMHTDEFMQFLPVESERGWVMMVDDARTGLKILQKAQQDGHGDAPAVSRPRASTDQSRWRVTNTIDELLNVTNFAGFQESCADRVEENINIIKRETGITDAEIIRIPSLYQVFNREVWHYAGDKSTEAEQGRQIHNQTRALARNTSGKIDEQGQKPAQNAEEDDSVEWRHNILEAGTPPELLKNYQQQPANVTARSLKGRQGKQQGSGPAVALYPATINSIVLGNKQIIAANPYGPEIDGQDVLAAAVSAAYQKAGYTVHYIDDWFTHHVKIGDVHCGSNVVRELTDLKWW